MKQENYEQFVNDCTYINNLNTGAIVDADKTQSGLSFNTGQIYNKEAQSQQSGLRAPNFFYADGTQVQSNYITPKNNNL